MSGDLIPWWLLPIEYYDYWSDYYYYGLLILLSYKSLNTYCYFSNTFWVGDIIPTLLGMIDISPL